jgi:hypothetical protein
VRTSLRTYVPNSLRTYVPNSFRAQEKNRRRCSVDRSTRGLRRRTKKDDNLATSDRPSLVRLAPLQWRSCSGEYLANGHTAMEDARARKMTERGEIRDAAGCRRITLFPEISMLLQATVASGILAFPGMQQRFTVQPRFRPNRGFAHSGTRFRRDLANFA